MASAKDTLTKDLETIQTVVDDGGLSKNIKRDKLVRNVKKISACLARMAQDLTEDHLDELRPVAEHLVQNHLVRHKSNDVKILVACAVADVLRLFAPNAPYSQAKLKVIFQLFINQLKGLAESSHPSFSRHFHLLECLSQFGICLVLVELGMESMVTAIFNNCLALASNDLSPRIEFFISDILASLLDEMETVPVPVLEEILKCLVAPMKDDNPGAYRLATRLIDKCKDRLDGAITLFLQNKVLYSAEPDESDEESDSPFMERQPQLDVVYELSQCCPSILMAVIPKLQELLQVEDDALRAEYVELVGQMVTGDNVQVVNLYDQLLEMLIKRFVDKDKAVRILLCQYIDGLMQRCSGARAEHLHEKLCERVVDPVEKVRAETVSAVCEALLVSPERTSVDLLSSIGDRVRDKKLSVRKAALTGLASLFRKHCGSFWKDGEGLPAQNKCYIFIPSKILQAYSTAPELVLRIFESVILDPSFKALGRSRVLIGIFTMLDEADRECLNRMLHRKSLLVTYLRTLMSTAAGKDKRSKDRFAQVSHHLLRLRPTDDQNTETGLKYIQYVMRHKNRKVCKLLDKVLQPVGLDTIKTTQRDFVASIKQNAKAAAYFKAVSSAAAPTLITGDMVPLLFQECLGARKRNRSLRLSAAKLVEAFATREPLCLNDNMESVLLLLTQKDANLAGVGLKIASLAKSPTLTKTVAKRLRNELCSLCREGSPVQAGLAARAIQRCFGDDADKILSKVMLEHIGSMSAASPDVEASLACLAEIASEQPAEFVKHAPKVADFVLKDLLPLNKPVPPSGKWDVGKEAKEMSMEQLNQAKVMGVRCLAKYLVHLPSVESDADEIAQAAKPIIKCFTRVLQLEGRTGVSSDADPDDAMVLEVSKSFLDLFTKPQHLRHLQPPLLQLIAITAHHDEENVRHEFTRYLEELLVRSAIPFQFSIVLAYCGTEPVQEVRQKRQKGLRAIIQRYETRRQRLLSVGKKLRASEVFLADLVHCLSHHPDLEQSHESWRYFLKILQFYLSALLGPTQRNTEPANFGLLMRVIDNIRRCRDPTVPVDTNSPTDESIEEKNWRLYVMAELALRALRQRFQNKEWAFEESKHPTQLVLPKSMFVQLPPSAHRMRQFLPEDFVSLDRSKRSATPVKKRRATKSPKSASRRKTPASKRKTRSPGKRKSPASASPVHPATPPKRRQPRRVTAGTPNYSVDVSDAEFERILDDDGGVKAPAKSPSSAKKVRSPRLSRPSPKALSFSPRPSSNGSDVDMEEEEEEDDEEEQKQTSPPATPSRSSRRRSRRAGDSAGGAPKASPKRKQSKSPTKQPKRVKPSPESERVNGKAVARIQKAPATFRPRRRRRR